jgi:hypothetical protein
VGQNRAGASKKAMIPIFEAAWEIHTFLTRRKILYVIIGGVAVQKWGEPRVTNDVDLTISIPTEQTEKFINQLAKHFKGRVSDLQAFARRTRVIPIYSTNNSGIDLSLNLTNPSFVLRMPGKSGMSYLPFATRIT